MRRILILLLAVIVMTATTFAQETGDPSQYDSANVVENDSAAPLPESVPDLPAQEQVPPQAPQPTPNITVSTGAQGSMPSAVTPTYSDRRSERQESSWRRGYDSGPAYTPPAPAPSVQQILSDDRLTNAIVDMIAVKYVNGVTVVVPADKRFLSRFPIKPINWYQFVRLKNRGFLDEQEVTGADLQGLLQAKKIKVNPGDKIYAYRIKEDMDTRRKAVAMMLGEFADFRAEAIMRIEKLEVKTQQIEKRIDPLEAWAKTQGYEPPTATSPTTSVGDVAGSTSQDNATNALGVSSPTPSPSPSVADVGSPTPTPDPSASPTQTPPLPIFTKEDGERLTNAMVEDSTKTREAIADLPTKLAKELAKNQASSGNNWLAALGILILGVAVGMILVGISLRWMTKKKESPGAMIEPAEPVLAQAPPDPPSVRRPPSPDPRPQAPPRPAPQPTIPPPDTETGTT